MFKLMFKKIFILLRTLLLLIWTYAYLVTELNSFFSVNGKPEPLQTNEVKHIKKELRQIRDMCNQLLDKLDQREPHAEDTNVVDSSSSALPTSK